MCTAVSSNRSGCGCERDGASGSSDRPSETVGGGRDEYRFCAETSGRVRAPRRFPAEETVCARPENNIMLTYIIICVLVPTRTAHNGFRSNPRDRALGDPKKTDLPALGDDEKNRRETQWVTTLRRKMRSYVFEKHIFGRHLYLW